MPSTYPSDQPVTPAKQSNNNNNNNNQETSPSPSPPRNPPVLSEPGPRARALDSVFDQALKHTLDKCSYDNFAACFPTPAEQVPGALRGLHGDFVGRLDEMCRAEFSALLQERDVVRSLNDLDALVADAKKRKGKKSHDNNNDNDNNDKTLSSAAGEAMADFTNGPMPPHLLPPSSILAAHLSPFLAEKTAIVSSRLETEQKANLSLADEITIQGAEIDGLLQGLEAVVADLSGAAAELGQGQQMQEVAGDLESYATGSGAGGGG
ncbi:MAG: hypothetical protein M1831_002234 [Alyxoria varia]|nr:MAG: hypothetical protein M1831_002234 [Alyxoria varia]